MPKSASSSPFILPGNHRLVVEAANFEISRWERSQNIRLEFSHVAILRQEAVHE